MALSGTVQSWKGIFGFVDTEDGTSVYIHSTDMDGGRLRVGRTVKFDMEAIEGREDRMKGVNVTGEGVLAKGEKLVCRHKYAKKRRVFYTNYQKKTNIPCSLRRTSRQTRSCRRRSAQRQKKRTKLSTTPLKKRSMP